MLVGSPTESTFFYFMESFIYDGMEFRRYLDTDIYSNENGDIITNNFKRSKRANYFKQSHRGGYLRFTTSFNGVITNLSSHRVIATCWIPNPDNKEQVNHINGIKDDNRVENLEWNTRSENGLHAFKTGLSVQPKGENHIYFGKRGGETVRAKKVIDTSTGKIYDCLKDAQKDSIFSYKYLSRQLTGDRKNLTNFQYIKI